MCQRKNNEPQRQMIQKKKQLILKNCVSQYTLNQLTQLRKHLALTEMQIKSNETEILKKCI